MNVRSKPSHRRVGAMTKSIAGSVLAAVLIVAATETSFRLAEGSGRLPSDDRGCAVLVLGFPADPEGTPSAIARFRTEAGVRVFREQQCHELVLSGGAVRNEHIEAESMALLARSLGVPAENIVLERRARSTWENVGCTAQLVPSARVLVVSDSLHARRAARYACRQGSALCERFLPRGVAPPNLSWWSVPAAVNELRVFARDLLLYRGGAAQDAPTCGDEGGPPR